MLGANFCSGGIGRFSDDMALLDKRFGIWRLPGDGPGVA
jgi:hypothetical protein